MAHRLKPLTFFGIAALVALTSCAPENPKEVALRACLADKVGPKWDYALPDYTRIEHIERPDNLTVISLVISLLANDASVTTTHYAEHVTIKQEMSPIRPYNAISSVRMGDSMYISQVPQIIRTTLSEEVHPLEEMTEHEKQVVATVRDCAKTAGLVP